MTPALREASSQWVKRAIGSRFAKPIARGALAAAGLLLLAFIGRTARGGCHGDRHLPRTACSAVAPHAPATSGRCRARRHPWRRPPVLPCRRRGPSAPPGPAVQPSAPASTPTSTPSRGRASPDDPVFLNAATVDDLRRLPGIGDKRANAIVALRARLVRFRAIEDLLKVKGDRSLDALRLDPAPPPAPRVE